MRRQRLLWRLYPSYLLITLASLLAVGWLISYSVQEYLTTAMRADLQSRAQLVDSLIGPQFSTEDTAEWAALCRQISDATKTRVTVIRPDGTVIYDSDAEGDLKNHLDRPEVQEALAGRVGEATRFSSTVNEELKYLAIPVLRDQQVQAVVRTSVPTTTITQRVRSIQIQVAIWGVVVALLAAAVSLFMSHRITKPLKSMQASAERFARGEFTHKMVVPESVELADLAETLNYMAQQLEERIRALVRQGNEQEAVMASMVEGVLAVDTEQRVISLNKAASQLLGQHQFRAPGRSLQEVIRNADLRRFVSHALEAAQPIEGDIVMHGSPDRVLQAHGTALRDTRGQGIGAVIVLNDVTGFRRLENIRRDFVANVSHELKTPITSIKGFVETLLDGALENREDAERFLKIIAKQGDRLNSIIEDLLSLSKIEQSDEADIALEDAKLRNVLEEVWHDCQALALERRIDVQIDCDERLIARVNPPLLEQAITNLLDNAIKYSDEGGHVRLSGTIENNEVLISVSDEGRGIPAEHLPRIFERFYRVDKARSRTLGGTGLGLSIVKHIVNVHRGRVTVESAPGEGSTFTIHLPAIPANAVDTPKEAELGARGSSQIAP